MYCFLLMGLVKRERGRVVLVQTRMELQQGHAWLSVQTVQSVSKEEFIKLC